MIYLYDANDHNVGYGLNLTCDWSSERGCAPFADTDTEDEQE